MNTANPPIDGQTTARVGSETTAHVPKLRDRAVPGWVRFVSYIFTIGISLCVMSIAVMALFFESLVVDERQLILSPLFAMVGCVALLGILLLEFAHSRALAGFRDDRRQFSQKVQGYIGAGIGLFLAMVNPLLALPSLAAAGIAFGSLKMLAKYRRGGPLWDFDAEESVPILIGRDSWGMKLAAMRPRLPEMARAIHLVSVVAGALFGLACASWLAGKEVLSPNAVAAVTLLSIWSAHCLAMRALLQAETDPGVTNQANTVIVQDVADEDLPDEAGLVVRNLTVSVPEGRNLLSDVSFDLPPGSITGIIGETGGGKTLLLRALADPFGLPGLDATGSVQFNGNNLWERRATAQAPQAVFLPSSPLILPASGLDNLTCFHGDLSADRGRRFLEKLVFSSQAAYEICGVRDATLLPDTQKRCLAMARGFLLSPTVYFMDRPEDGLPEKQIAALLSLIRHETRLGRSVVLVSENRALLDACDKMIVMQEGRIIDFGDAKETRARRGSGWMRFVGARQLETEDNLDTWIRSHFKRDGDEANRRKLCMIASEMLAFSCQNASSVGQQKLSFEFKHFEEYCMLKLQDTESAVSSAQLAKAKSDAEAAAPHARLSPLAAIIRESIEVEATVEMDRRVLMAKIQTYDPRKSNSASGAQHAPEKA